MSPGRPKTFRPSRTIASWIRYAPDKRLFRAVSPASKWQRKALKRPARAPLHPPPMPRYLMV